MRCDQYLREGEETKLPEDLRGTRENIGGIQMLDYNADHYCPVYKKVICADLCYDSVCCLNGEFKISSTKELAVIEDIDEARKVCEDCPYSDLGGGMDEWVPDF